MEGVKVKGLNPLLYLCGITNGMDDFVKWTTACAFKKFYHFMFAVQLEDRLGNSWPFVKYNENIKPYCSFVFSF